MKQLGDWARDFDMFGHPVKVFYKGSDTYKTKLGLLCTMIVCALTLSYFTVQLIALVTMSDPDVLIMTKTLLEH